MSNDFHQADGNKVRALREKKGWTQEELAEEAGPAARTIWSLEQSRPVSLYTLRKVANALGVEIVDIYHTRPATIQGYVLIGQQETWGPFEIWKALAPHDIIKLIKIVSLGKEKCANKELESLTIVKKSTHPCVLGPERFEVVGHTIQIVSDPAKSLKEYAEEFQAAGLPGIPRGELLEHIASAAAALDFMAKEHGIFHLDLRPESLLLVEGRCVLADFGIAMDLGALRRTATDCYVPAYAAPEMLDGTTTPHSDQFSLAVIYQQLLTGARPWPVTNLVDWVVQLMSGIPPQLEALPLDDQCVIARALSKRAEDRFPTCRAMVDRLLGLTGDSSEGAGELEPDGVGPPEMRAQRIAVMLPPATPDTISEQAAGSHESGRVHLAFFGGGSPLVLAPGEYLFGRGRNCDIRPEGAWVSHQHARLIVTRDGSSIRDLGSRNGTFINGARVIGERELHHGDKVQLGSCFFEMRIVPGAMPTLGVGMVGLPKFTTSGKEKERKE